MKTLGHAVIVDCFPENWKKEKTFLSSCLPASLSTEVYRPSVPRERRKKQTAADGRYVQTKKKAGRQTAFIPAGC